MAEESKTPNLSPAEHEAELRKLQLEEQRLRNRQLAREVQKLEMEEQNVNARAKGNARVLAANEQAAEGRIAGCNHKKGGKGLEGFKGRGQDQNYAVIKHLFPNNDVGVFCLRCPKIWLPPIKPRREDFDTQKEFEFAVKKYAADEAEYRMAVAFPTDNEMSTSGTFQGGNFAKDCREAMHAAAAHPQTV